MTVPAAASDAPQPILRILAAPDTEPPFDPEPFWDRPPPRPAAGEQLPLDWPRPDDDPPVVEPPAGPPGAKAAVHRLAVAYLEVVQGRRARTQLAGLATASGAESIDHDLTLAPPPADRIRVHRIHVTEPLAGIAEAVVVLAAADRAWSLAVRLEHRSGAWRCVRLETVGRDRMATATEARRRQVTRANRHAAISMNSAVQPAVRNTSSEIDM